MWSNFMWKRAKIWKERFDFYTEEEFPLLEPIPCGDAKRASWRLQNSPNWICRHFLQNYQVCFLFLYSPKKALNFNEVTPMVKSKIILKEHWIFALFARFLYKKKYFRLHFYTLVILIYKSISFRSEFQFCR